MRLSDLPGVPGQEDAVRDFVLKELDGLCDSVRVDALGNVIAYRKAAKAKKGQNPERVMISAHMDEIGFLVRHVDEKGYLRVQQLGGFDTRNLFARNVTVHARGGKLPGIMQPGGKPVHIASAEERKKIPEVGEFFIDLGLDGEEAGQKTGHDEGRAHLCLSPEGMERVLGSGQCPRIRLARATIWLGR